jgi:acyl-CoA dehydrogenase family protein 9
MSFTRRSDWGELKTTSFMRSLCMGHVEQNLLIPYPSMSTDEKQTLKELIHSLQEWLSDKGEHFRKWDRAGEFPISYLQEIRDLGLFSLIIPETYGGLSLSTTAYSRILQELAKYDGATAVTVGAHSSIGMKGLLLFGTEAQKTRYLPAMAEGKMIAAFCLTEPGSGSDAASIRTHAKKEKDHWVLQGDKLWITNGGIADFFTVFAKTDTSDGAMTAFIVTKDMPGVSVGPHEDKMGLRASSTTTVHFDKVILKDEYVLGPVGKGFKVAMSILNSGRTGLGGGCVGSMKHCIELATKQAKQRQQFGRPISEFGMIKQKIGQMVVDCYVSESLVNMVSGLIDQGHEDYSVEAAISKVFASDALWKTADEALQIAAGNGFMCDFPYERIVRDARINRIFEGTNEILRLYVSLTAMQDVGQELKELSQSMNNFFQYPIQGLGLFTDYAKRMVHTMTGLGAKTSFTQLHPSLVEEVQLFEELTRGLTLMVDRLLRKHGKQIMEKQFALRRLSEIMIDLFALACTLARVHQKITEVGVEQSKAEKEILEIFSGQARKRIQSQLNQIDHNDDELIKSLASMTYEKECFPWDNI